MPTLRSTHVVLPDGARPATIRFEGGRIVAIGDGPADHDFGDLVILPGLVDCHVHINEPGRAHWEGFATATRAAAAGGTTTLVDMPLNSIPPTVDVPALHEKQRAARGRLAVDVGFWGGVVPGSATAMEELVQEGVCGFKVFTVDSGVEEFPPLSWNEIAAAARRLAGGGVPLLVHAEDPNHIRVPGGDPRRYSTYLDSRPASAEAAATDRVAEIAASTGATAHILHVSGGEAVEAVARARGRLSAETCPHYLMFVAGAIPDGATQFKCAPPIRGRDDREALWDALRSGTIGMVVSDHSPSPPEMKASGDFFTAWGGIASLELRLMATWHEAQARGHDAEDLARWLASSPSDLTGLWHRKGRIAEGLDADFTVFDPDGDTVVEGSRLQQRHPITPYDGLRLRGSVVATFLRGHQVYGDGAPGRLGELVRRSASSNE